MIHHVIMYIHFYFYEHFVFKITPDIRCLVNFFVAYYKYHYLCEWKNIKDFIKIHFLCTYLPNCFFLFNLYYFGMGIKPFLWVK